MARHFGVGRKVEPKIVNPEAPLDAKFDWPDFDPSALTINDEFIMGWAYWLRTILWISVLFLGVCCFALLIALGVSAAHDNGKFADSPLKAWFDQLASGNGLCCSFVDGISIKDVDWDTKNGKYRVHLKGQWIVVPDVAVVKEPNRFGPAVVWPYEDVNGKTQIRCFLPGSFS
jgi:hypothetical protein